MQKDVWHNLRYENQKYVQKCVLPSFQGSFQWAQLLRETTARRPHTDAQLTAKHNRSGALDTFGQQLNECPPTPCCFTQTYMQKAISTEIEIGLKIDGEIAHLGAAVGRENAPRLIHVSKKRVFGGKSYFFVAQSSVWATVHPLLIYESTAPKLH